MGVVVGGVGLSEFEDIIKHTIPQILVRVVAEIVGPRRMEVNLGPPEDNRQLIIGREIKVTEEKRNKPVGATESLALILSISSAISNI